MLFCTYRPNHKKATLANQIIDSYECQYLLLQIKMLVLSTPTLGWWRAGCSSELALYPGQATWHSGIDSWTVYWKWNGCIWLSNCSIPNFLIYEENLIFFFISVKNLRFYTVPLCEMCNFLCPPPMYIGARGELCR